jgi:hypothetical protein
MPAYFYTITKGGYRACDGERRYIYTTNEKDDILLTIIKYELERKRKERLDKLFKDFVGDSANGEEVEKYLPLEYKEYAYHIDRLKNKMCSIYEIVNKYTIKDVERAPNECYGCLNNSPGQRDHMECSTGCLHSKYTCFYC